MIAFRRRDRLGRRVTSTKDWQKVRGHIRKTRTTSAPLPIFRKNELEGMSVDLLRNLSVQTAIADREVGRRICGWAVLLLETLRDHDLKAELTRDVDRNPYHVSICYCGESRDFDDLQFRLELTRCVTAWQERVA